MRTWLTGAIALVVALALAAAASAASAPTIKSGFSSNPDNWSQVANFYGISVVDQPGYTSAGGHPGGAIFAKDEDSGPGEQVEALLSYNDKFSGDFSHYYGGKIAFDLRDNHSSSKPVRLGFTGADGFFITKARPAPGRTWEHHVVRLSQKGWRYRTFQNHSRAGYQPATKQQFKAGLGTLKGVVVLADYSHAEGEKVTLDNYAWKAPGH